MWGDKQTNVKTLVSQDKDITVPQVHYPWSLDAYTAQRWAQDREVNTDIVCMAGLPGLWETGSCVSLNGWVVKSIIKLCEMRTGLPLLS